ncbi:hypothetical protein A3Q56_07049 [Intoshia linei]|uniref:EGF-like domain-containing protein n=1 Tax=Intoshia linei TaxID=1819745 RepID=A0A177AV03_9BILA|nr:hypothetical protein A3Q56_07049 [Intoshia linei]
MKYLTLIQFFGFIFAQIYSNVQKLENPTPEKYDNWVDHVYDKLSNQVAPQIPSKLKNRHWFMGYFQKEKVYRQYDTTGYSSIKNYKLLENTTYICMGHAEFADNVHYFIFKRYLDETYQRCQRIKIKENVALITDNFVTYNDAKLCLKSLLDGTIYPFALLDTSGLNKLLAGGDYNKCAFIPKKYHLTFDIIPKNDKFCDKQKSEATISNLSLNLKACKTNYELGIYNSTYFCVESFKLQDLVSHKVIESEISNQKSYTILYRPDSNYQEWVYCLDTFSDQHNKYTFNFGLLKLNSFYCGLPSISSKLTLDSSCINGNFQNGVCKCSTGYFGSFCRQGKNIIYKLKQCCLPTLNAFPSVFYHIIHTAKNNSSMGGGKCFYSNTDVDECLNAQNECSENSTCKNNHGSYECKCNTGYMGVYCKYKNYCDPNPCANTGECITNIENNLVDMQNVKYTCLCKPPYYGKICKEVNYCWNNSCKNNATCINDLTSFKCSCPKNTFGSLCQYTTGCFDINCNNGTCSNTQSFLSFKCNCNEGYDGQYCNEKLADVCINIICRNNGTCSSFNNTAICSCTERYSGTFCEGL